MSSQAAGPHKIGTAGGKTGSTAGKKVACAGLRHPSLRFGFFFFFDKKSNALHASLRATAYFCIRGSPEGVLMPGRAEPTGKRASSGTPP